MIVLYMKNRPWSGEPKCDYVRVISPKPPEIMGYRLDGTRLVQQRIPDGYLRMHSGWYHPATAWEIEEFRRMGGSL